MCTLVRNFLLINWLAIIQGIAGIWVAIIATIALNTWKRQIKAHKHIEFLDELTDTIHNFILSMSEPITRLEFTKIGIDCYAGIHNEPEDMKNPEAVAFIKERGKSTGDNIRECLTAVRTILSKMKSLVVKGQIFGIDNYSQCREACVMLEWSYNQIEYFFSIIGDQHLNWYNPEVQSALEKVLLVNPADIKNNLTQQNTNFLLFAKQAHTKILK